LVELNDILLFISFLKSFIKCLSEINKIIYSFIISEAPGERYESCSFIWKGRVENCNRF
jgi:hypothetical protein